MKPYDPRPRYPIVGGTVERGYEPLLAEIAARSPVVVALDGPATLDWQTISAALADGLRGLGKSIALRDAREFLLEAEAIERLTLDGPLRDDDVFAPVFRGSLRDLYTEPRLRRDPDSEMTLLIGPGAAFASHDLLWVADHPKRLAAEAVKRARAAPLGLGLGDSDAGRRLTFIDWPALDRHRCSLLAHLDRFVDLSDPRAPRSLAGDSLRATLSVLAERPFRTLPTFAPGPWGGQWLRQTLGIETDGPNLAWSYELIAPESSLLLGEEPALEVGFELVIAAAAREILGPEVEARFGSSLPIRFDYLDTLAGGNLSVHCHPLEPYMRDVFGWDYTQHESYYVMRTMPGARIFLGLVDEVDLGSFATAATRSQQAGTELEIEKYVQAHPARQHALYLIPAGTPHASSAGNVVLEISATPYLYSLRFYDWLREDLDGGFRPVQLGHAFANLNRERVGARVRDELLPEPRVVRRGDGFAELELGRHAELFFAVHRLDFETQVDDDTAGRFHVLNLVEGDELMLETSKGGHRFAYAETILVPAAVGRYRLRVLSGGPCRVVKAFVA